MKRFTFYILFPIGLIANVAMSADMSGPDAFIEGNTLGQTNGSVTIDNTTATDIIPGYTGTTPTSTNGLDASGMYAGGAGNLLTPGVARNSTCMSMIGNPDVNEQQACDAVKVMNDTNANPYTFTKEDPLFAVAKSAYTDPVTILANNGMTIPVSETTCTTETVNIPADTHTEVCQEYLVDTPVVCALTQVVQVDKDYLYTCTSSTNKTTNYPCSKILTVQVDLTQSCVPGTWYGAVSLVGIHTVEAYCDMDRADGKMALRFTPTSFHGICQYGYLDVPIAPFTVSDYVQYGGANADVVDIHHWKGSCTITNWLGYEPGYTQGCTNNICSYTFRHVDSRWGNVYVPLSAPLNAPGMIPSTTDTWIDQCVALEAMSQ